MNAAASLEASRDMRRREVTHRLRLAIVAPLLVLVAVGVILLNQTFRMSEDATWVEHSDEVIAKAYSSQASIVDQEASIRGYLLTDDSTQLDLFRAAHPRTQLVELRALVLDDPKQTRRVDEILSAYDAWSTSIEATLGAPDAMRTRSGIALRKGMMESLRDSLGKFVESEEAIRKERAIESSKTKGTTRTLTIGLFTLAAVALAFFSRRQMGAIAATFSDALDREQMLRISTEEDASLRDALANVLVSTQGDLTIDELGGATLASLAEETGADVGAFFTPEAHRWQRRAAFALASDAPESFQENEGVLGRAANDGDVIVLNDVPPQQLTIRGATASTEPATLVAAAFRVEQKVEAIVELGFLGPATEHAIELVRRAGDGVAMAARAATYRERLRALLEESRRQGDALQAQQEELRSVNEELEHQSHSLQERQEELETINTRLEERTEQLEKAESAMKVKAMELERASQYKSEFLANMSHELRTPLNSSLILAKLLADNEPGNLTEEQLQYARTIHASGTELLVLINDVLDLSKVEAGKVDTKPTDVALADVASTLRAQFQALADQKRIAFRVEVLEGTPDAVETDANRLQQILKNLLSNAFKFTTSGSIDLRFVKVDKHVQFIVRDTGMGIPPAQQRMIFDAFWQADGTSARKVGGTGLGLSISRDLALLLGGTLEVKSTPGEGSTFTLSLPITWSVLREEHVDAPESAVAKSPASVPPALIQDDRDALDASRRTILIVEDDLELSRVLLDLARELGFQCVVAHEAMHGFALAKRHLPSAILLDMKLPDRSGLWVLDQLKHTPETRHLPVHVISPSDNAQTARAIGAFGYSRKPVDRAHLEGAIRALGSRREKRGGRLLILGNDAVERAAITDLLEGDGIEIVSASTVPEAVATVHASTFDSVVVALSLGAELFEHLATNGVNFPPIISYGTGTGRRERSSHPGSSLVVKNALSPESLLEEVTLFLHQVEDTLPADRQQMLQRARSRDAIFEGRKVLVAEDDVRNIFALSRILEPRGMNILVGRNGKEALRILERTNDVDIVLMDIMMPEMDGLTAIREIRKNPAWAQLPILALTAKAMRDDRDRCLEAGASDYIAKPIDTEVLVSLMRVWMSK